jgi:hypothetical protein
LKVFKMPLPKNSIVRVWHVNNVEGDVFNARFFGSAEGHRECDDPDQFNSFSIKAIERL